MSTAWPAWSAVAMRRARAHCAKQTFTHSLLLVCDQTSCNANKTHQRRTRAQASADYAKSPHTRSAHPAQCLFPAVRVCLFYLVGALVRHDSHAKQIKSRLALHSLGHKISFGLLCG